MFEVVQVHYFVLVISFLASFCNVLIIYCGWRILRRNRVFTHVFVMWMSFADLVLTGKAFHSLSHSQMLCVDRSARRTTEKRAEIQPNFTFCSLTST